MKTTEITITTRSRNLGYEWTNRPDPNSPTPAIQEPPATSAMRTSLKQVEAEMQSAARMNGSAWYRGALYVNGQRVVGVWQPGELPNGEYDYGFFKRSAGDIVRMLREDKEVTVLVDND